MKVIQDAAFIVCLDDAHPESSTERCYQFLYADGSNRWYDKTLQLIVCSNGISASLMEHSALDGISVEPLHEYINRAIHTYDPQVPAGVETENFFLDHVEHLPLLTNNAIEEELQRFRKGFKATTTKFTFASLEIFSLGADMLRSHKCPIQSGIQLAIQLACRRFFGYNPPALETVSMAHFRKGRVEVHHIISATVARFLSSATDSTVPPDKLRERFFDATKAHAKSLSRAGKGRTFSRHMLAMEWMVREGETTPDLFVDSSYAKMRPGKVLTSNFTTGWLEGGFAYPVPESILVYFEIKDERCDPYH